MRRTTFATAVVLATAAWLAASAACDEGTAGPSGPVDLGRFDDAMIEALCAYATRCPGIEGGDLLMITGNTTSAAACASRLRNALASAGDAESFAAGFEAAATRGTGTWDAELAADCMGWLRSASCDDMISGALEVDHPECERMFRGTVDPGGTCYIDEECDGGWCDTAAACPGGCVAFVAAGGSCAGADLRCAPGYDCSDGGACDAAVRDTLVGEGGACGGAEQPCRYGLFCSEGSMTCEPFLTEGASCLEMPYACIPGTACSPGTGQCTRIQFVTSAGAMCGEASLSYCDPVANLYCDPTTERCVALPGAGEACMSVSIFSICRNGHYCDEGSVCRAQLPDGASCADDDMCLNDTCGSDGRCTPISQSCVDTGF